MSSISDILQNTLDLIGSEGNAPQAHPPIQHLSAQPPAIHAYNIAVPTTNNQMEHKTASSILLEQRKKLKQKMDEINNTDFSAVGTEARPKYAPMTPYLNQVASSDVDKPKYWKTKKGGSGAVSSNKKTIEKRSKGSDYQDRLMSKLQAKHSKQKLKNSVKGK